MMKDKRTIAAIATAYGEGGIGIVKISGEMAIEILRNIFCLPGKKPDNDFQFENRHLYYGHIAYPKSGKIIDEVMVSFMRSPLSYTREDICEIYCHGSIVSLRKILELVLDLGAEPAEPGEFTKKAFLNGRIDLAQAEAVIDVIRARSDIGFDLAVNQMEGSLSVKINELREKVLNIVASVVVEIDYPDEDGTEEINSNLEEKLICLNKEINDLIKTADVGKMIREGINTVIVGKPNVGKSSLMNELLRESRAIVTEIPGTTRDIIEETVNIGGIPIKITDTAGIRDTVDQIEIMGIEKTKEVFNKSDLIIFMLDAYSGIEKSDIKIAEKIGDKKCFVVINKIDLGKSIVEEDIKKIIKDAHIINMSLKQGEGLDELENEIQKMFFSGDIKQGESLVITNIRHKNLLKKASLEIEEALEMLTSGEALDFVHVNINQAFEYLGEITGKTVSDDIMDKVFGDFCVGK